MPYEIRTRLGRTLCALGSAVMATAMLIAAVAGLGL